MLTHISLTNDQGHEIPVAASYESVGREVRWLAQFTGTTRATGELAGTAADEGRVPLAGAAAGERASQREARR